MTKIILKQLFLVIICWINWNLKANNILGNEYHTYGVSSAFCQQTYPSYCKRESVYPMPEQTFTFSLGYDF